MSYTGRVLALDIGSKIGWAKAADGAVVESGTEALKIPVNASADEKRHERLYQTHVWLLETFAAAMEADAQYDVVAYERPFARGDHATRSLWGQAGIIEASARTVQASILDVPIASLKKFAGITRGDKPTRWARDQGYVVGTDHEADALVLAHYVIEKATEE